MTSEMIKKQSALAIMYLELHALAQTNVKVALPTREEAELMPIESIRRAIQKIIAFQCALSEMIENHRVMFEEELTFSLLPLRSAGCILKNEELLRAKK